MLVEQHGEHTSRLDESIVTSGHNESSLVAGDITTDSVQVHVR